MLIRLLQSALLLGLTVIFHALVLSMLLRHAERYVEEMRMTFVRYSWLLVLLAAASSRSPTRLKLRSGLRSMSGRERCRDLSLASISVQSLTQPSATATLYRQNPGVWPPPSRGSSAS